MNKIKRALRIGCVSVLAVVITAGTIVAGVGYYVYGEFKASKAEHSSARTLQKSQLIAGLNNNRIAGPNGRFYIAFSRCDVYQTAFERLEWNKVALKYGDGSYPKIMTGCTRTDSWRDEEWLYVSTCAQAIGAGGGCARAGTFKTQNGIEWFRREGLEPREAWVNAL